MSSKDVKLDVPVWLLGLITFSGTFAMHVFVPALPAAGQDLNATVGSMQMTVSLYILGLACGQLVYGPLSDRFGRRPILLAGLILYTIAGAAAFLAPQINVLIVSRLFQALGGCAGLVIGRAIVRDTSEPADSARRLAAMNLMVTVGPGIAPLVGGAITSTIGWRFIFLALCGMGIANILMTLFLIPETGGHYQGKGLSAIANAYSRLLSSKAFLGFAVGGGCATTAIYAFIASAPFIVVRDLNRPVHEIGVYLMLLILGIWIGSIIAGRIIGHISMSRLLVSANLISVVSAFVFLAVIVSGLASVWSVIGSMMVLTIGVGIASPLALTHAMNVDPEIAGSASGLYGFMQMVVGAACTALAGTGTDPALSAACVLAGAGVIGQISFWLGFCSLEK